MPSQSKCRVQLQQKLSERIPGFPMLSLNRIIQDVDGDLLYSLSAELLPKWLKNDWKPLSRLNFCNKRQKMCLCFSL